MIYQHKVDVVLLPPLGFRNWLLRDRVLKTWNEGFPCLKNIDILGHNSCKSIIYFEKASLILNTQFYIFYTFLKFKNHDPYFMCVCERDN